MAKKMMKKPRRKRAAIGGVATKSRRSRYADGGVASDARAFLAQDAQRRTGQGNDTTSAALTDRELEGRLMASLLGPFAAAATVPVGLAALGYEGVKGLGRATGAGRYFPGPFRQDETTSPASFDNVLALLKGYSERATRRPDDRVGATKSSGRAATIRGKRGGKVRKVMHEFKTGKLHSGSKKGPEVTSRKQAIAIALSEARKAGESGGRRRKRRVRAASGGVTAEMVRNGQAPMPAGQRVVVQPGGSWAFAPAGGGGGASAPRPAAASAPAPSGGGGGSLAQQSYQAYLNGEKKGIPAGMSFADYQNRYFGGGKGSATGGGSSATTAGGTFGQAQNLAGRLANFNPLTGQARATQNELLTTGAPTDVSGLTQAAQIQAGQQFNRLADTLNERYAAMGLGSSSAREAALARERANLSGQVAATGLQAGVQAQEAATSRRAGAVGAELGASGQTLAGMQTGVGALGQLTGIAEGGRQFDVGQANENNRFQATLNQNADLANQQLKAQEALQNSMYPSLPTGVSNLPYGEGATYGRGTTGSTYTGRTIGSAYTGPYIPHYATGGRVYAPDFFSEAAYGQKFSRPKSFDTPDYYTPSYQRLSSLVSRYAQQPNPEIAARRERNYAERHREPPTYQSVTGAPHLAPHSTANLVSYLSHAGSGMTPIGLSDPQALADWLSWMGPERIARGLEQSGRLLASSSGHSPSLTPTGRAAAGYSTSPYSYASGTTRQHGAGGGVPQPELPQEMGIQYASLLTPRRQFYDDGGPVGGSVPGHDDGTDKVPALLRAEELVVTPELTRAIEMADPMAPNPRLVHELQRLTAKPLEKGGSGDYRAADGGQLYDPFGIGYGTTENTAPPASEVLRQILINEERQRLLDQGVIKPGEPTPPRQVPAIPSEMLQYNAPTGFESVPSAMPPIPEGPVPGGPEFAPPPSGDISISTGELKQAGNAGYGKITPRGRGRGSFSAMTSTVPSAQPRSDDERRYEDLAWAQRRRDLIQANLATDPVGSPDKQARQLQAFAAADQQVKSIVAEIDAAEQRKIAEGQTQVAAAQAQANLTSAVADQLRAAAQKQTADAATAKVLQDAAANDPAVANLLNIFNQTGLGKTERGAELAETILGQVLAGQGIQIKENGWFRRLFGAPRFELAPSPEQATPSTGATGGLAGYSPEAQAALAQFLGVQ